MKPLEGRLAVVTGASRGIGLAASEALAAEGAVVVRLARSLTAGARGPFRDVPCDLADAAAVVRATTTILGEWGTPEILVQNAGTFTLKPLDATDPAELDASYALNVRAPFLVAQAFLPAMRAAGRGIHVTIGITCDHVALPENGAYTVGKYGVRALHEVLSAEYRGSGVRFSLISPGATDTPLWDPLDPDHRPGFPRRAEMLRAEDVADAVRYVATRPPHASVDWLRLSPVRRPGHP